MSSSVSSSPLCSITPTINIQTSQFQSSSEKQSNPKMTTKSKLFLIFFLVSLTLLYASLAKQDPELKQCKHQCRVQQQIGEREREKCEDRCEEYHKQKKERESEEEEREKQREKGHGGSGDVSEDSRKKLKQCQSQCERQEGEQRQLCRHQCKQRFEKEQGNSREEGREEEEEGEEREEKNPYVFEERHFTARIKTENGRIAVLQKFTERSELLRGIENYRIGILEANPNTFIVPAHFDADGVFFVANGRGRITLIRENKKESFNIQRGHIMRIPAGTTIYMINRDDKEKLVIAKLFRPISTPGEFQPFFGPGGEDNPQSFYRAFSIELLEASLKVGRDKMEKVFGQQKQGVIVKASREQIKALSEEDQEAGMWPFGGGETRSSRGPFDLLNKRPSHSNQHGRLFEADPNDYKELRDLDVAVSFANITRGSMIGPYYVSKATKISMVIDGEGYFEMACPHVSSQSRGQGQGQGQGGRGGGSQQQSQGTPQYQKITARLRRGTIFVVPAGHPIATVASNNKNLQILCFEVNAQNSEKFPLAGKRNVISLFEKEAKELAFGVQSRQVDEVFGKNDEELFFPGPRQQQQEEGRAYA